MGRRTPCVGVSLRGGMWTPSARRRMRIRSLHGPAGSRRSCGRGTAIRCSPTASPASTWAGTRNRRGPMNRAGRRMIWRAIGSRPGPNGRPPWRCFGRRSEGGGSHCGLRQCDPRRWMAGRRAVSSQPPPSLVASGMPCHWPVEAVIEGGDRPGNVVRMTSKNSARVVTLETLPRKSRAPGSPCA